MLLLQRTPVLRVFLQTEFVWESGAGDVLKSAFALAALGGYNSLAGATAFNVTSAAGAATGAPKSTFAISGTVGTAINGTTGVTFSVSGAPGTPKSYGITDGNSSSTYTGSGANSLPPGLTLNPLTGNTSGGAPYYSSSLKGTINGTPTTAGTYSVRIWATDSSTFNNGGNSAYAIATFTITGGGSSNVAPAFTTQPASQTVTAGAAVTFTAAASGTPAPTYQWQLAGVNISGATSASYSIASAAAANAGSYTVVATNSAGTATSSAAALTVNAATSAPVFTTQPASLTVTAGAAVAFTVAASGTPAPTYQWQLGGVNISGATGASYSIASAAAANAGSYTVVATNSAGTATSSAATLTVNAATGGNVAPSISTQPASQTVTAGSAASFTVAASGTPAPTYQWQKGGVSISNATGTSYSIASAQSSDAGSYTVVVTNSAGTVTSAAATLTVNAATSGNTAPTIGTQPTSQTVSTGHNVSFYGSATGNPTATYQWQISTNSGSSWANVAGGSPYGGVNTNTLTITNATAGLNGSQYRFVATNTAGTVTSNAVTLTVGTAVFPSPIALVVDSSGTLWVSDNSANTIEKITGGTASLFAGTAGQQGSTDGTGTAALFRQPGGLAVDSAGNLYVADTGNSIIRKITASGVVTTFAGSASSQGHQDGTGTAASFNAPAALALDSAGNLYVADTGNSVIRKITAAGVVTTLAGTAGTRGTADGTGTAALFNQPAGIAVDNSGTLYVSDTVNQTIRRISAAGAVSTWVGLAGVSGAADGAGANALFTLPAGLTRDNAGNLYVADSGNASIRMVTPAGVVSTLAGMSSVSGFMDGSGSEAFFNQPKDVKFDGGSNLYVADSGNAAIRQVTLSGEVTTLMVTASSSASSSSSSGSSSSSSGSEITGGTTTATAGGGAIGPGFVLALLAAGLWRKHRFMVRN
ncbi:MAG: immunoglobulin domain-containing protein [Opitutales bacterium]